MRRVEVNWGARGRQTFKCDGNRLHDSGRVLFLLNVRSQDIGANRILAATKMIPLEGVIEVDESEW